MGAIVVVVIFMATVPTMHVVVTSCDRSLLLSRTSHKFQAAKPPLSPLPLTFCQVFRRAGLHVLPDSGGELLGV